MTHAIVVTRHATLTDYMREKGILPVGCGVDVISHVEDPEVLVGRVVYGVLPYHLALLAKTYVNVGLSLPPEMRGKELTLEEVRKYALPPVAYRVEACALPSYEES